jgi:hypothetical protein
MDRESGIDMKGTVICDQYYTRKFMPNQNRVVNTHCSANYVLQKQVYMFVK